MSIGSTTTRSIGRILSDFQHTMSYLLCWRKDMTRNEAAISAIRFATKETKQDIFIKEVFEPGALKDYPDEWIITCSPHNTHEFAVGIKEMGGCCVRKRLIAPAVIARKDVK